MHTRNGILRRKHAWVLFSASDNFDFSIETKQWVKARRQMDKKLTKEQWKNDLFAFAKYGEMNRMAKQTWFDNKQKQQQHNQEIKEYTLSLSYTIYSV